MIDERYLRREERAIYKLRKLYRDRGYELYKASKFDEYDFYAKYRDFLPSRQIVSFTDTDGKLMALRPDVTLSIAKAYNDGDGLKKLCYNENVYRMSEATRSFCEIPQTGIECLGKLGTAEKCEVVRLALESLEALSDNFVLDVSHLGFVSGLLEELRLPQAEEGELLELLKNKPDEYAVRSFAKSVSADGRRLDAILFAVRSYANMAEAVEAGSGCILNRKMQEAFDELRALADGLSGLAVYENLRPDFSLLGDTRYYNGIVFRGYIENAPSSILSGGQYDLLMSRLKKGSSAIGFAVYLDKL